MNVSLTPELEEFVDKKVVSGLYQTASEVVREGLRLLKERDENQQVKLDELRRAIAIGLEEAAQGKLVPADATRLLEGVRDRRNRRTRNGRSHPNAHSTE